MNPRLRALLKRKDTLFSMMRGLESASSGRDFTAAEQEQYRGLEDCLRDVNVAIGEEERAIQAERDAPALPGTGGLAFGAEHPTYDRVSAFTGGRRYREMFAGVQLDRGGFRDVAEFLAVLRDGLPDPRLMMAAATGSSEGVGADGGALVPTQFVAELLDASLESEIVRPRASVRPMDSNSLFIAGFDTSDHSTSIGGFAATWVAEGGQFNVQKAKVRSLLLKAHKLGILTAATNELLADSSYFAMEMPELMVQAIGFGLDEAFLRGDGVGKPRGVLNDPALVTVGKEQGQAADTITWENLKAMFARLHPQCKRNAIWVASHTTQVQLLSLVQLVRSVDGTENVGGTYIPVMREEGGRFFILGIEVLFTEKLPVLGDKGDILLADFSQYGIGLRREMTLDRSGHFGFDKDETYFRGILRADGMGRWSAPVQPRNGSSADSLSWCVTLEERDDA